MKSKKWIAVLVAFIVVLGGAFVLYKGLGDSARPTNLSVSDSGLAADEGDAVPVNPVDEDASEASRDVKDNQAGDATGKGSEEGQEQVPDFLVYDKDGKAVRLHEFFGKPIVLNFWASWCGPCKSEMPHFEESFKQNGDDITYLFVNLTDGSNETVDSASKYIKNAGFTFPVYFDKDSDAAMTYGVYSIPTTLFIDKNGYALANAVGAIDKDTLAEGISLIKP